MCGSPGYCYLTNAMFLRRRSIRPDPVGAIMPLVITVHRSGPILKQIVRDAVARKRAKPVQKRQGRPGQRPPRRRTNVSAAEADFWRGDQGWPDSDRFGGDGFTPDGTASSAHAGSGTGISTQARNRRLQKAWRALRQRHKAALRAAAARQPDAAQRRAAFLELELHKRIWLAAASHPCCQLVSSGDSTLLLEFVEERTVIYRELGLAVEISVPTWRCGVCRSQWETSACDAHCFPSSPVQPEAWIDLQLLESYRHLSINGGLSMTAYADMVSKVRAVTTDGQPAPDIAIKCVSTLSRA